VRHFVQVWFCVNVFVGHIVVLAMVSAWHRPWYQHGISCGIGQELVSVLANPGIGIDTDTAIGIGTPLV
jgi:hypothetical protein